MKVSLNWLREYIDLPSNDAEEIREAFESLGHEVEGVEALEADWTGVVIAEVTSVEPHPDADKVRLCQVTYGGEPIDVVCGAWNFDVGAVVPFATPGAVLPGGFEIGSRRIRGIMSNGMICSERELGLGDDHAGILVLDADAPVGDDFADHVERPDVVFDLTITPNRPDAMSMVGLARELSAYYGVPYRLPDLSVDPVPGTPSTTVEIADPSGCLRFTGRELQGVTVGPSPFWMRQRLRNAGLRAISNAVDVTNYVMLELGQPLHAFDADRIEGDHLVVRRAEDGETMVTLDDVERTLVSGDLVICDATGPISMAGTMGGATSEVGDDTTRVFLEAAAWDPPTIMWMSRRHGLRSEASARFERGVDPALPLDASARAARLLCAAGSASVLEGVVDEVAVPVEPAVLELSVGQVTRVLGPGISADEIAAALTRLGMDVDSADPMTVTVPTFRRDLERPIDLVEEVARLRGFESFPESVPRGSSSGLTDEQRNQRTVRSALIGAGFHEAVHLSFMSVTDLDHMAVPADHPSRLAVTVRNPLREEEGVLRTTLLPGLLGSLRFNASHGAPDAALFEMGRVFFADSDEVDDRIPRQPRRLGFAAFGTTGATGLDLPGRPTDVFAATGLVRLVAAALGIELHIERSEAPGFHPGRCAAVSRDGAQLGHVGEIHPSTAQAFDLPGRVLGGELDLDPLVAKADPHLMRPLSVYPRSEFDLAFVVPADLPAERLLAVTSAAAGDLLESSVVFDEYRGISDGRKSLAIRYVLRASDHTLTNEEVAPVRSAMITAAETVDAELRGAG